MAPKKIIVVGAGGGESKEMVGSTEEFRALIEDYGVRFLVDVDDTKIRGFESLEDGGRYTLGSPEQQLGRQAKTLEDGIPPLLQNISLSPPSVPKAEDHAPVEATEMNFGVMRNEDFRTILHNRSRCWDDCNDETGYVSYASENDVAFLVSGLVKDISKAMGIDFETFTEIGAFGLRPDVWVVTWNMIPVGVIDVKKPEEDEICSDGESVLDELTVLGELYDFQMQLPNFYGVRPAFGILTTFECWRVCWIPEADVDVDNIAETSEPLPKFEARFITPKKSASEKKSSPPGRTPSKTNPVLHDIVEEDESSEEGSESSDDHRVLHMSKIYKRTDDGHFAMRAIAAALCKMTKAKQNPFNDPFDKLTERMLLRFTKGTSRSIHWCRMGRLEGEGKWNKYASPKKYLYAIEDLGRGSDGRVWLTCTSSGAVCVLKFPIKSKKEELRDDVRREMENWKAAYPEFKVFRETWCGRDALRMPHFAAVKPDDRSNVLQLVEETLETQFAAKGLVHEDVAWRNIGLYKDGADRKAVVFDLGRVRDRDKTDDYWVDDVITKLRRGASTSLVASRN